MFPILRIEEEFAEVGHAFTEEVSLPAGETDHGSAFEVVGGYAAEAHGEVTLLWLFWR